MNPVVNAATACFPGMTVKAAIEQILLGASEPMIGTLGATHIQCCPQNLGHLSESVCEDLRTRFPKSTLRLHANARVLPHHVRYDASTFSDERIPVLGDLLRQVADEVMTDAGVPVRHA